jgi:deoxyribose-phosphate aldolase
MKIEHYLDSTYLKTAAQANVSEEENYKINALSIEEAIECNFKLIMIRPEIVSLAKKMITNANSKVSIGTVVDFPLGQNSLEYKLEEAQKAIDDGADDLDFVVNYEAFKEGKVDLVKEQILACTTLGLNHNKIVKWIIEVAALNDTQIALIKNLVISNFKEHQYENVFVKSSTGFYKTQNNLPNGATFHTIKIMLENSFPLSVKAAGGVRNYEEAVEMVKLGVKRIGTSSAKAILEGKKSTNDY